MKDKKKVIEVVTRDWVAGVAIDDVLHFLRNHGFQIMDCIRFMRGMGVSLADAKKYIHTGQVWRDEVVQIDQMHEALAAELEEI